VAETTTIDDNPPMANPSSARASVSEQGLQVACIAYDGWSLFEAGIASEVFGILRPEFDRPLYRFRVVQAEAGVLRARGGLSLRAKGGLALLREADLVVVPGWRDVRAAPPPELLRAIHAAHRRGTRLLSICTGSFVLAAAGVLDGRSATTHWRYAAAFRERFPKVALHPDVLYVDDGDVITSAGSAAGIDACLYVVRKDYGAEIANTVARTMVTPPHRSGGQAQFVPAPVARDERSQMATILDWARGRIEKPLKVADLARRASMSGRTLLRHFVAQVGMGPHEWIRRERVALAQRLLEQSGMRLQRVADEAGFGSVTAMRDAFRNLIGAPPTQHRKQFRKSVR
jgi:AraC family transcriptional activator FtrA